VGTCQRLPVERGHMRACSYRGDLAMLKWARANGCPCKGVHPWPMASEHLRRCCYFRPAGIAAVGPYKRVSARLDHVREIARGEGFAPGVAG
jgi:hypothetical protein